MLKLRRGDVMLIGRCLAGELNNVLLSEVGLEGLPVNNSRDIALK